MRPKPDCKRPIARMPKRATQKSVAGTDSELSERDQKRQRLIRRVLVLKNPFDVLGGEPDESVAELKKRYKKLALLIHPDKVRCAAEARRRD